MTSTPSIWSPMPSAFSLSDIGTLEGVSIPVPQDGMIAFVKSTNSYYELALSSSLAVDGVNVIPTFLGGTTRWLRLTIAPITSPYTTQPVWYINAATGHDDNDGKTPATAIRTFAELIRRWGPDPVLVTTDHDTNLIQVNILSNIPSSDPLILDVTLGANTNLVFIATPTQSTPRTFTAVTVADRSSNVPWDITDAGNPDLVVGVRIHDLTNPNADAYGFIVKSIGVGQWRTTWPTATAMPPAAQVGVNVVTPREWAPGDSYVIETLKEITIGHINIQTAEGGNQATGPNVLGFCDLVVQDGGFSDALWETNPAFINFTGCIFLAVPHITSGASPFFMNCLMTNGLLIEGSGFASVIAGGVLNANTEATGASVIQNGTLQLDADVLLQDCSAQASTYSSLLIGRLAVFDAPADGVILGTGRFGGIANCVIDLQTDEGQAPALWGNGNGAAGSGFGLMVGAGCDAIYRSGILSAILSINGTNGDFSLAGPTIARSWNDGIGSFTTTITTTWTHLTQTIGAGGFGGSAQNINKNAHIMSNSAGS